MRRFIAALAVASASLAATVLAAPADAATVTQHGIKVAVPSSVTSYNGKKATVKPTAKVKAGVNESVIKAKVLVYAGKKKVASGSSVKLKVGTYTERVQVAYQSWTYTTRTSTKRVLKDPDDVADYGDASNVTCRVAQVDADGFLVAGTCTSPNYPGQTVAIDDVAWCSTEVSYPLAVGETATDNVCYDFEANFKPYYVTVPVRTKVKTGIKTHTFTTPKKHLKIVDGGHRKVWSGGEITDDDGYYTQSFAAPAHWKLSYDYVDLSDDWGCFFYATVYRYRDGDWDYYDNVVNVIGDGGSSWVKYLRGSGRMLVRIDSTCDYWDVIVTWK